MKTRAWRSRSINRNEVSAIENRGLKELEKVGSHLIFLWEVHSQGRINRIFCDLHINFSTHAVFV